MQQFMVLPRTHWELEGVLGGGWWVMQQFKVLPRTNWELEEVLWVVGDATV